MNCVTMGCSDGKSSITTRISSLSSTFLIYGGANHDAHLTILEWTPLKISIGKHKIQHNHMSHKFQLNNDLEELFVLITQAFVPPPFFSAQIICPL